MKGAKLTMMLTGEILHCLVSITFAFSRQTDRQTDRETKKEREKRKREITISSNTQHLAIVEIIILTVKTKPNQNVPGHFSSAA